jgi:hypothetical protein
MPEERLSVEDDEHTEHLIAADASVDFIGTIFL